MGGQNRNSGCGDRKNQFFRIFFGSGIFIRGSNDLEEAWGGYWQSNITELDQIITQPSNNYCLIHQYVII